MWTGDAQGIGIDPLICTYDVTFPSANCKICSVSTKFDVFPDSSIPRFVNLQPWRNRDRREINIIENFSPSTSQSG